MPAGRQGMFRAGMRRNYVLNVVGTLVPLLVSLVTVPLYIRTIGTERYGVMSLVWILLGYVGFLDFGLTRASANALSRLGTAGAAERVPVLVTSLYLNLGFGMVGGLVMYAAGLVLVAHTAALSDGVRGEITAALPWMACMLPLGLAVGVGTGAIESRERFLVANVLTGASGVIAQLLPLSCAVLFGASLLVVVPAALAARAASALGILAYVARTERPMNLRAFDRSRVRSLLGYGAWVSVTSMISPMLETFDQMLVGALLGPAALAHYAVPMSMTTRSQFVASALARTLFPRLSRLERQDANRLALRSAVTLAYGFAAVCAPAIVLGRAFLTLWIGGDFAVIAAPVATILLAGAWLNGVAFIPFTLLQSQGRPDLPAKIHMGEIVPLLAAVWLLTRWLGLPGAALAWTGRVGVDLVLLLVASGQWRAPLLVALPAASLVAAGCAVASLAQPVGFAALAWASLLGLAVMGSAAVFDGTARDLVASALRRSRDGPAQ